MPHLLGDLAGAVDQLLFGERVVGAALQSPTFGHQPCAAETQLMHLLLNVGPNLAAGQTGTHQYKKCGDTIWQRVRDRHTSLQNLWVTKETTVKT